MVGRKRAVSAKSVPKNTEDDVVAEYPIVLLPVPRRTNAAASINRVQFPQRRYWLRSAARLSQQQRCFVAFKRNVKQLRVAFLRDHCEPSDAGQPPLVAAELSDRCDSFIGEGYSEHENLNYALGFSRNEKLFLLPIEQHYEMHYANANAHSDEAPRADSSSAVFSATAADTPPVALPYAVAPVRIRFARVETDAQKRRREESALFKQRLIEQDPWLTLDLQEKNAAELCDKDIAKFEKSTEPERPTPTYSRRLRTGAECT